MALSLLDWGRVLKQFGKKIDRLGLEVVDLKGLRTTTSLKIPKELPTVEETLKMLAGALQATVMPGMLGVEKVEVQRALGPFDSGLLDNISTKHGTWNIEVNSFLLPVQIRGEFLVKPIGPLGTLGMFALFVAVFGMKSLNTKRARAMGDSNLIFLIRPVQYSIFLLARAFHIVTHQCHSNNTRHKRMDRLDHGYDTTIQTNRRNPSHKRDRGNKKQRTPKTVLKHNFNVQAFTF